MPDGERPSGKGAPCAFFFDRDSTLSYDPGYLHRPEQIELLPGVREAFDDLRRRGCLLFLFTNQSGPARGMFPKEDVIACNRRLAELLGGEGVFTRQYVAWELPDAPEPNYRKPSPRYLNEAVAEFGLDRARCWMVGDRASDLQSGLAAGIGAVRVTTQLDDPRAAEICRLHNLPTIADMRELAAAVGLE